MNDLTHTSSKNTDSLVPGDLIANCYILFNCIGRSPRSSVWTCRHKDLEGRTLAIRILNSAFVHDQKACARFHREVVASYTVNHPNVVRTHEFINDGRHIAYTMEFMDYGNLKTLLDSGELLQMEDIVLIATQIAAGLEGIHAAGLIHRNLKPGNVFFSAEGEVKVADFGIARADSGPKLTNDGEVLGTVGYTSPEYLTLGQVDARSDVYALGLIIYEMITGNYPYYSPNPVEAIKLRVTTDPIAPSELRPECPLELSNLVLRAMARDPKQRFESAEELRQELDAIGVAAKVRKQNAEYQLRKQSFWKRMPQQYSELGVGYEGEQASAISQLRARVRGDVKKKNVLLSVFLTLLFASLGVVVAFVVYRDTSGRQTLSKIRAKIEQLADGVGSAGTAAQPSTIPSATENSSYTVQPGDTLSGIAVKFGVSTKAIMDANGIDDPKLLRVGTSLQIPQ